MIDTADKDLNIQCANIVWSQGFPAESKNRFDGVKATPMNEAPPKRPNNVAINDKILNSGNNFLIE